MIDDACARIKECSKCTRTQSVTTVSGPDISALSYIMRVCLASCTSNPHLPLPNKTVLPKSPKTSSASRACSCKNNICAEALACCFSKYITLIMLCHPSLPLRSFKATSGMLLTVSHDPVDETESHSHALGWIHRVAQASSTINYIYPTSGL